MSTTDIIIRPDRRPTTDPPARPAMRCAPALILLLALAFSLGCGVANGDEPMGGDEANGPDAGDAAGEQAEQAADANGYLAPNEPFDTPSAFDLADEPDEVLHDVPLDEVHRGVRRADPRDAIPPIDNPTFEPLADCTWADADRVLVFTHGEVTRVYPTRILDQHEIVNDTVDGQDVAIVFCPLCGTGSAFDRNVGGITRRFGVSGYLYNSDVLLWDDHSESFWSQIGGAAVVGPETGAKLIWLDVVNTTMRAVRAEHEGAEVLVGPRPRPVYERTAYPGWARRDSTGLFLDPSSADRRLHQKAIVTGIIVGGVALAIPHERLAEADTPLSTTLGGQEVRLYYDADADTVDAVLIEPAATDEPSDSEDAENPAPSPRDDEPGSLPEQEPGGEEEGSPGEDGESTTATRLTASGRLVTLRAFWFAWRVFHPDTEIWSPEQADGEEAPRDNPPADEPDTPTDPPAGS